MSATDVSGFSELKPMVDTYAASANTFESESEHVAWDNLINEKLIEWGRNPDVLRSDEIDPPNREVVKQARDIAIALKNSNVPAPLWVVPDAEGGICFEWHDGGRTVLWEILDSLKTQLTVLENHRVIYRQPANAS